MISEEEIAEGLREASRKCVCNHPRYMHRIQPDKSHSGCYNCKCRWFVIPLAK